MAIDISGLHYKDTPTDLSPILNVGIAIGKQLITDPSGLIDQKREVGIAALNVAGYAIGVALPEEPPLIGGCPDDCKFIGEKLVEVCETGFDPTEEGVVGAVEITPGQVLLIAQLLWKAYQWLKNR